MKEFGEQWIEEIDGKRHMLKAVLQPKQRSHLYNGNDTHPCFKCFFQMDDYDCAYPSDKWVCDMQRGVIIKDLGILNEDGCLPCPFCGEYPKIIHPTENMPVVSIVHTGAGHRILLEFFSSEQEAIDEWNRRAR